ncbi:MAG: extracellular solute-binding protein [Gammaproteobacteria bacterium]|nr:extracellular solute-binding protein [Gammaproteobacteria bacterium]NIR84599.1 extracellular solute-binding protein [Gammaproteobacteria bacterium]NIR90502.1 extracellular solute-binding protein [Gammaproteobacteria bacterium]NIU05650.1 extracellular solute-binding protein [Gammaproteobacteria bacterium]NIV52789.1 extracellular solute-binding protein [Gammaproteobacteria bacterium]
MKDKGTERYQRLLERYRNGDVDRRTFLGLLGAAGMAAGLGGGVMSALGRHALAAEVKQVRFDGWGGVVSEAFRKHAFDPYEQATGVKVVDGTFGGTDQYLTRVKASQQGEYNIFHASGVFDYARYVDLGYGTVLNEDNIPNLKYVMKALEQPFRKVTGGTLSATPYDYGTTALAYNKNHISDEEIREKGANILNDPQYKGKIGGWGEWRTRIWYGALQTGQHPNDIQDLDAVWEKLREHRDLVLKYWESGAELMSLLAEEEIYVTEGWSGRIAALQQQGHPIGYYDPPNSYAWQECLFVLKGSPMRACEELLNFMLEPDVQIAVAEGQNYPPALDPTKYDVGDKVRSLPAFDPTGTLKSLTFADPQYWNGHEADWAKQFSRIQKGF